MIDYQTYSFATDAEVRRFKELEPDLAQFLENHLDEYGDSEADILRCLAYASSRSDAKGGNIVIATDAGTMVGAVVLNDTGMSGYIPENILVYIAVHRDYRGKGLGKGLMKEALDSVSGSIALHVEPDNPAKFLYEKLGFTNKYLEMRLQR